MKKKNEKMANHRSLSLLQPRRSRRRMINGCVAANTSAFEVFGFGKVTNEHNHHAKCAVCLWRPDAGSSEYKAFQLSVDCPEPSAKLSINHRRRKSRWGPFWYKKRHGHVIRDENAELCNASVQVQLLTNPYRARESKTACLLVAEEPRRRTIDLRRRCATFCYCSFYDNERRKKERQKPTHG